MWGSEMYSQCGQQQCSISSSEVLYVNFGCQSSDRQQRLEPLPASCSMPWLQSVAIVRSQCHRITAWALAEIVSGCAKKYSKKINKSRIDSLPSFYCADYCDVPST